MKRANRKAKMTMYTVRVVREVEEVALVDVAARNAEEASQMAENIVDNDPQHFKERNVVAFSAIARVKR